MEENTKDTNARCCCRSACGTKKTCYCRKAGIIVLFIVCIFVILYAQNYYGVRPIWQAVWNDDIEAVRDRLTAGDDINERDRIGCTPLIIAARSGQKRMVDFLISVEGLNIDEQDNLGYTALASAARNGHTEIVTTLIAAGADFNIRDHNGKSPLMLAAYNGYTETAKVLKAAGAAK